MLNRLDSYAFGDFSGGVSPFIFFASICISFAISEFLGEDVAIAAGGIVADCVAVTFSQLVVLFALLLKSNSVNDDTTVFIM